MPNRILNIDERSHAMEIVNQVRGQLRDVAGDDRELLFAYRRVVFKELIYDERSKPGDRRKLKNLKRKEQEGKCPRCSDALPETHAVLDRFEAYKGYVADNVRLICQKCDAEIQKERRYT